MPSIMHYSVAALAALASILSASASPIRQETTEKLQKRQITSVVLGTGFSDDGPNILTMPLTSSRFGVGAIDNPLNGVIISAESVQAAGFVSARCLFGNDLGVLASGTLSCGSTDNILRQVVSSFDNELEIFPHPMTCVRCDFA